MQSEDVFSPCDAVELDICLIDLEVDVDTEQVESRDWRLVDSDVRECPVPQNIVAAGDVDVVGNDARAWVGSDSLEPGLLASDDWLDKAEL